MAAAKFSFQFQLEIWDTAGQERFRTITQSYYRNANGLILLYDITKSESLTGLGGWIDDVKRYAAPDILMILVGAKQDLAAEKREVTEEQARTFALHHPEIIDVVETSAKVCDTDTRLIKVLHPPSHRFLDPPPATKKPPWHFPKTN